jgi:ubiquitin carboxyl-terminal hydrolase 8
MDFKKYQGNGLSGLTNLGNTCFINACVQILSHTYELNDFLNLETYKKRLNKKQDSILLLEWDNLRKILWENNCIVSPGKFLNTIQKLAKMKGLELFTGFSQNDLPEFLIFIIDSFHCALSRKVEMNIVGNEVNETDKIAVKCFEKIKAMYSNDYSEIWNMFYGIHISQLKTINNNEFVSMNPEPYFIINLPIPINNKSPSLYDCFDLYVEGEVMEGENKVFYEKTNTYEDMRKNISFWSFPTILVIDIKRFNSQNRKNQVLVTFPLENLNLSKYVIGYNKESYVYDLYGVCNHSGNVLGGHYTSYVKNANGKWYHFNDTSVVEIGLETQIITPKAYCFFYRKKTVQ